MADRRDDVDSWLSERIDPLPPPPGTFDLHKRRARRRKYRRLAITATTAAVIVAAAVTVPQVVKLPVLSPSGTSGVTAGRPGAATGTGPGTGSGAPLTGAPDGSSGVSQVRFLNNEDGWAFGPELFFTGNGGHSWSQVSTNGLRVTDLETVGDRVFALFASCTGGGASFGGACTNFTLYSSPATASAWAPVGASTSGLTDGAAHEAASVVLTGSRGFLLAPGGALYAGPVNGSGPWTLVNAISSDCPVGPAQLDGQPAGVLLTAVNARELILACASGSSGTSGTSATQKKLIFSSPNGGGSRLGLGAPPPGGIALSAAGRPSATVVLATNQGIDVLPAGDIGWQTASLSAAAPASGFGYVGMTTDSQGIALPANPASGTVWFTYDGGQSWQPSHLNGS